MSTLLLFFTVWLNGGSYFITFTYVLVHGIMHHSLSFIYIEMKSWSRQKLHNMDKILSSVYFWYDFSMQSENW